MHSNSANLGNDTGGDVTVKAKNSFVSLTGLALQANSDGGNGGGKGGHVIVQAGGTGERCRCRQCALDASTIEAKGSTTGGAPTGGIIEVRSFAGTLTGAAPGSLNASGDGAGSPGLITLQSCLGTTYTGASTPSAQILANACPPPATPDFPVYLDGPIFNTARWDRCGESSIDGVKFNDKDNSGSLTAGDELLGNWQIHITGPSFDQTVVTDPNPGPNFGHYHVVVPAGPTYPGL